MDQEAIIKQAPRAAAGLAGDHSPWRRTVETYRSTPFPALRGSFRLVLGSGVVSAACVIHLGSKRGSGLLLAACAAKGAGLRGGARRRAARRPFQSWVECARGLGGDADAHRSAERAGQPGRVDGDVDRRRSEGSARGWGTAVVLRAPGLHESMRGIAAEQKQGPGRSDDQQ